MQTAKILSLACLAFGVLFYLASVGGLLWHAASPPMDVGLVATTAVFVLLGILGLLLKDAPAQNT